MSWGSSLLYRLIAAVLALSLLMPVLAGCGNEDGAAEYNRRGSELYAEGLLEQAIANYSKAIELSPDMASSYSNRGLAYALKGQWNLAIADCNKAIKLDPNHAKAYNARALAYDGTGRYELAVTDFTQVLALTDDPQLIAVAKGYIDDPFGPSDHEHGDNESEDHDH